MLDIQAPIEEKIAPGPFLATALSLHHKASAVPSLEASVQELPLQRWRVRARQYGLYVHQERSLAAERFEAGLLASAELACRFGRPRTTALVLS